MKARTNGIRFTSHEEWARADAGAHSVLPSGSDRIAAMSAPSIRFRPLAESDLPLLVEWFAEPEIGRWWNQPAEIVSVRAKYLPRIEEREPTLMWIAEIDGEAGGLLQSYLHVDHPEHDECVGVADAVGIDYLLAGPHRGRGRGRLVLRSFAEWTLERRPDASCCVATPAQANEASWRALQHAGFSRVGECQPPDEPLAYIYVRGRDGSPIARRM
jgi:aminoglycoside 6'-N-acetyltransferase